MEKQIKNYPDYTISDKGEIQRYGKTLKPATTPKGYLRVQLSKDNKQKMFFVHRLVYETFVGEIPTGLFVNHIDENKQNNSVENLNLMSAKDNDKWGTRNSKVGRKSKVYILQLSKDGEIIGRFNSSKKHFESLGYSYSNILRCCKGEGKTHKGYLWKFEK